MKKLILTGTIAAFVILSAVILIAQKNMPPSTRAFIELHSELQDYRHKNVYPKMLEWKQQLDNSMSSQDLDQLNKLRTQADALKDDIQQKMQDNIRNCMMNPIDCQNNAAKMKRGMRDKMMEHRGKMMEFADDVIPLADKYEQEIDKITEDAKSYSEKWKKNIDQIINQWKDKYSETLVNMKNKRGPGRRGGPGRMMHDRGMQAPESGNERSIVRFMLWNGDDSQLEENPFGTTNVESSVNKDKTNSFPNPFTESAKIKFNLEKSDNIKITVSDANGNKVAEIFNGQLEAGPHEFEFNSNSVSGKTLNSGVYIYMIEGKTISESGKMILDK